MRSSKYFFVVVAASVAWASVTPSHAAVSRRDRIAAQKLINKGLKAEKREQWDEALDYFTRANDLRSTPTSLYHIAKALQHKGKLLEAREFLQTVLDNKMGTYIQRKKVKAFLAEINEQIPHLTINVPEGVDATVTLDGKTLTDLELGKRQEMNPGSRTIRVEAEGYEPYEKTVDLSEGSDETVTVELVKAKEESEEEENGGKVSSDTASGRKTIAYVSLAVGGLGLLAGTGFGLAAKSTRDDLRDACPNDVCPEDQRDNYERGKSQATYSTIGFVVGGIGLGAGAYFLLTAPDDEKKKGREVSSVHVEPIVGLGSVMLKGSF